MKASKPTPREPEPLVIDRITFRLGEGWIELQLHDVNWLRTSREERRLVENILELLSHYESDRVEPAERLGDKPE